MNILHSVIFESSTQIIIHKEDEYIYYQIRILVQYCQTCSILSTVILGNIKYKHQHNNKEKHYKKEWQNKRVENAWRCYNALV